MRRVGIVLVLVILCGCSKGLSQCEDAIKAKLKAPATYKRVAATDCKQPGRCEIDFDAANSYGTPLRDRADCFLTKSGASVFLKSEMDAGIDAILRPMR